MREREIKREIERETERDKQRERERERETHTQRERESEIYIYWTKLNILLMTFKLFYHIYYQRARTNNTFNFMFCHHHIKRTSSSLITITESSLCSLGSI